MPLTPRGVPACPLSQVIMKIIKYSADNLSSGSLCGLDVEGTLQITHCFPAVDEAEGEVESHQTGMLKSLREV